MRSSPLFACFRLLLTMLIVLQASAAHAQASNETAPAEVALNRFEPAFAGDKMFGVESAHNPGHPGLHLAVLGDYAHNPLVLRREDDDESIGSIVSSQLFVHLNGTLALWDQVSLNVNAPIAVYQSGDDPTGGGLTFESPNSAEFGDLRAGLRVGLYGEYFDPLQVAVGGYLWFPTGPSNSFVSDRSVRGQPTVMLGGYATDSVDDAIPISVPWCLPRSMLHGCVGDHRHRSKVRRPGARAEARPGAEAQLHVLDHAIARGDQELAVESS